MRLNKEQTKHLADTLRAVAFAQFAAFGYVAMKEESYTIFVISAVLFVFLEVVAVVILEDA